MENEHQSRRPAEAAIDGIFIDFKYARISLLSPRGLVIARLHLRGLEQFHPTLEALNGYLDMVRELDDAPDEAEPVAAPAMPAETPSAQDDPAQKSLPIVLSGRLTSQPKPGRPDRTGKPTAWAKAAMHREAETDTMLVLATFHRQTAAIATTLALGARITGQGYFHPLPDGASAKLPTFSIFNLLQYPGKVAPAE